MKNISIIVALAEKNAIGLNNKLLCHVPGDLKRFKEITSGHTVIMGKNTYFSLPKRPLPNRTNIVLTNVPGELIDCCIMKYSMTEALEHCKTQDECFVIGGGSVYSQFLPHAEKLYITQVHKYFEADTFFPEIDFSEWKLVFEETHRAIEEGFDYSYRNYVRIK
jgi:dihydrofolate reductase